MDRRLRRQLRSGAVAFVLCAALVGPASASARDLPGWLAPCGVQRLCGTLAVPLDRANPAAGTIGLNVVVVPAVNGSTREPDAIVAIAGGPGGASTDLAPWAQATFFFASQNRDLLLVDQRGTGRSKPLFCPPSTLTGASSPDRIRAYWLSCLGSAGVDSRLLTTSVAVDDLDEVRTALGYPQVDLYGGSYGATVVQYYLLRHGDRVRTAILDSGTTLDVPIFERWAQTNQTMLDTLFARCAAATACHRAFPSPARDLRTVLARLDRRPVRLGEATIDRDGFANALQWLSRQPATAAKIPLVLRLAAKGAFGSLLRVVQDDLPEGVARPQLMSMSIQCLEPWARQSESETARLGTGTYFGPTMVRSARYRASACSVMPAFADVPGADALVPSGVPALVLVGAQDPQDPLSNVAGIADVMPNAKIVVVRGAGHGAVNHGCTESLADTFVVRGTAAGLDTSCAAKAPLTPFLLAPR